MRNTLIIFGYVLAASVLAALLTPPKTVIATQQYTQYANQCVRQHYYPAGTNNSPNAFTRFYNTCNVTITVMLTTNHYGNNGPGAPGPGAFMVMGWPDNVQKDVRWFACVYPGEPTKTGSTFVNLPSYNDTGYQCLVPR